MPLTAFLVALLAKVLASLTWGEAFLLGALLSATDPVLSSSVITNPRVPRVIRHSLNLESGLNDGLALPAVLAFAAALDPTVNHFVWWRFVLHDIGGCSPGCWSQSLARACRPARWRWVTRSARGRSRCARWLPGGERFGEREDRAGAVRSDDRIRPNASGGAS
jgi:hypothetical protein